MLRPALPGADAQRGQRDEENAAQDVRDGHVEYEQVHLHAAAASGQRQASMVSQHVHMHDNRLGITRSITMLDNYSCPCMQLLHTEDRLSVH